jgi:SSS family solute:Na+ symporter
MIGGLLVAGIGLYEVGGLGALLTEYPEKFKFIYPATDPQFPWFGVYTLFLSIGIWYNCTNQFIVQRCLGARSEWDARMGVLFAGYMKIILPLLVVVPGIIAYKLFPALTDPDQAYPMLVKALIPAGLAGVVMAALASALMSHLSSVLNSSSTVFTMDLYRPLLGRNSTDEQLVRVGRVSAFLILLIATVLALWLAHGEHRIFLLIQDVGAWVAAPIAAVFLLGVLWKRATAAAATFVLFFGFPYTWLVEHVLLKRIEWLRPYDNWLNRTFIVWATCMLLVFLISMFTSPPDPQKIRGLTWSWQSARLPESEAHLNRGVRNLFLWWALFVAIIGMLYAYVIWFQFRG